MVVESEKSFIVEDDGDKQIFKSAIVPVTADASALDAMMEEDAGKGLSSAAEDNLLPMIYIFDYKSPQVDKRGADYIEGAEPGDIWLRNSAQPIVKGDVGLLFQHVEMEKWWVEWILRAQGGGFVARHKECPPDVEEMADPQNPDKVLLIRKSNGHQIMQTRYHYGFANDQPYCLPLKSTGHTISRQWMAFMNSFLLPNGRIKASWHRMYRMTTKLKSDGQNRWFLPRFEDAGEVSIDVYRRGKALWTAIHAGEVKPEVDIADFKMKDDDLPF